MHRFRLPLIALAAAVMFGTDVPAAESVPLVIGYERFGRHEDLSDKQSGSLLLSELNCTVCHLTQDSLLAPKLAPSLTGAGNRLREAWLKRFLAGPGSMHRGTTMPDRLHGMREEQRQQVITALVAYLGSRTEPFPTPKASGLLPVLNEFWNKGDASRGRTLYHQVGCVACHEPEEGYDVPSGSASAVDALLEQLEPEELAESGLARLARAVPSIPHGELTEKYSQRSLTMMLLNPASIRPDARMPNLRLQPSEAADLASYLLRDGDVESDLLPQSASPEQVELGRRYFHELQCANCHERDSATPNQLAKPLAEVNLQAKRSCLQNPTDAMPKYSLDDRQRAAIRASLAAPLAQDPSTVGDAKARELVQHRMLQLNCFGCHERTDESGQVLGGIGRFRKAYFQTVHQLDLGDEGRLPPPLTGVGRKFLPAALQSIFTEGSTARRPSMTIRMPSYPKEAIADIVQWLPKADQADVAAEARVFSVAQETAQIGRELVNTGCVECHPFRGESLPGAVGIDLHGIHLQVQPAWFLEFVRDPGTVKPRTRMPTFFPDGRSHRPDLLDGDVAAQVGAIWHYLKTCDPLPAKIIEANSRNFELVPADRPLLLRTFLRDAGNHAIAVGLPGRLNFAWDAERVRLATAWKGRFLDARSTWFERFAPPAEPLAEKVIQFPVDPCFQLADQAVAFDGSSSSTKGVRPAISFDGFRLDRDGYPTFLYHVGSWNVEDRLEADPSLALRRILVVRQSDRENSGQTERDLHWIAHAGKELQRVSATSVVDEQGMSVTLLEGIDVEGELSDTNVGRRWVFPLPEGREHRIIVEYQW